MKLRILDGAAIRAACPMPEAIEAVAEGFRALTEGRARAPLRTALPLGRSPGGTLLTMPASLEGAAFASVKVVSVSPRNASLGLPLVQAAVLVVDAATGAPRALLEGATLTALRTGAAGGLAARALAREDAAVAALYGAGVQARAQLEALLAVRPIREVRVVAQHRERAEAFARGVSTAEVRVTAWGADAARGADVVVCATSSAEPVFDATLLGEGVHVTGVGSYRPEMREIPPAALSGARVFVDQREAALSEAGELIAAVREGFASEEDILEIGDPRARRTSRADRTVFVSVGNAIQDLVVAARVVAAAERRGLGMEVEL